jgi:hypothetical protein
MSGNNILSVLASIVIYGFLGFLVISLFFSVFPLLAVLLLVILGFYAVTSVVNKLRAGMGAARTKKKFDEYGNRRTNATVISMEEAAPDAKPASTGIESPSPDKKDKPK